MGDFVEKLRLKELAEEDVYFAKRDAELIEALHRKELAKCGGGERARKQKERSDAFERHVASITERNEKGHRKLLPSYREVLDEIKSLCRRRGK